VATSPLQNGQTTGARSTDTQDLLDQIFGPSPEAPTQQPPASAITTAPAPAPPRNAIEDILGLFPSSNSPAPAQSPLSGSGSPLSQTSSPSAFSLPQAQSPPIQQQPQQPRLTSYTAYDKNELKVTLTPQTSAARPGVVNILARFQVSGPNPASALNFQAAVPKVVPYLCSGRYC
jgi:AP-1 complex subunit gamma-1